jgi:RES domain-containing protein
MSDTTVFRMHASAYAASDSSGALRAAGRWHSQGTRVVYAAEHISLALLETLIHAGGRKLPPRSLTRIVVPTAVQIEAADWMDEPASRAFGDAWVRAARTAVLRVPSIAVNGLEHNFVPNPAHPSFARIRFEQTQTFTLDSRFIVLT